MDAGPLESKSNWDFPGYQDASPIVHPCETSTSSYQHSTRNSNRNRHPYGEALYYSSGCSTSSATNSSATASTFHFCEATLRCLGNCHRCCRHCGGQPHLKLLLVLLHSPQMNPRALWSMSNCMLRRWNRRFSSISSPCHNTCLYHSDQRLVRYTPPCVRHLPNNHFQP